MKKIVMSVLIFWGSLVMAEGRDVKPSLVQPHSFLGFPSDSQASTLLSQTTPLTYKPFAAVKGAELRIARVIMGQRLFFAGYPLGSTMEADVPTGVYKCLGTQIESLVEFSKNKNVKVKPRLITMLINEGYDETSDLCRPMVAYMDEGNLHIITCFAHKKAEDPGICRSVPTNDLVSAYENRLKTIPEKKQAYEGLLEKSQELLKNLAR